MFMIIMNSFVMNVLMNKLFHYSKKLRLCQKGDVQRHKGELQQNSIGFVSEDIVFLKMRVKN